MHPLKPAHAVQIFTLSLALALAAGLVACDDIKVKPGFPGMATTEPTATPAASGDKPAAGTSAPGAAAPAATLLECKIQPVDHEELALQAEAPAPDPKITATPTATPTPVAESKLALFNELKTRSRDEDYRPGGAALYNFILKNEKDIGMTKDAAKEFALEHRSRIDAFTYASAYDWAKRSNASGPQLAKPELFAADFLKLAPGGDAEAPLRAYAAYRAVYEMIEEADKAERPLVAYDDQVAYAERASRAKRPDELAQLLREHYDLWRDARGWALPAPEAFAKSVALSCLDAGKKPVWYDEKPAPTPTATGKPELAVPGARFNK